MEAMKYQQYGTTRPINMCSILETKGSKYCLNTYDVGDHLPSRPGRMSPPHGFMTIVVYILDVLETRAANPVHGDEDNLYIVTPTRSSATHSTCSARRQAGLPRRGVSQNILRDIVVGCMCRPPEGEHHSGAGRPHEDYTENRTAGLGAFCRNLVSCLSVYRRII